MEHDLTIAYSEPDAAILEKVNGVTAKMKNFNTIEEIDVSDGYRLEDLYLINYLYANPKGFEAINGNAQALNFTKDLIEATDGSNVSFRFDVRAGADIPTGLVNLKIGDYTYRFAVLTAPKSELETPKYIGSDIVSNVKISSSATLPLDTALTVTNVENEEIEDALGTSVYAAYDISLYSNFKKVGVTNLESGKFLVSIPVPASLEGKEIIAYYITSTGEKEEHVVIVKNGVASFETDHFSTYILTEAPKNPEKIGTKVENPTTGDDIAVYAIIAGLSIVGVVCALIYFKKKKVD